MAMSFTVRRPAVPVAFEKLQSLIESEFTESTLKFYMNGKKVVLENPNPEWTLLDFIRSQHDSKGTKLGCGEGGCGACTVVLQSVDPKHPNKLKHLSVNACLFPLVGVVGKHLITIEGLGNVVNPHPLQERIAKLHGSQCGFCTPGIVMSIYAMIRNAWDPDSKTFRLSAGIIELDGHLDGNLCRCTGYKPILAAVKTFIVEDLQSKVDEDQDQDESLLGKADEAGARYVPEDIPESIKKSPMSCGRPGGCCRDNPGSSNGPSKADSDQSPPETSDEESAESSVTSIDLAAPPADQKDPRLYFTPYSPTTELIFPPALRKFETQPICYGDSEKIWLKPTSLVQLLAIKSLDPTVKLVGGSSEVQVEIRFKNSKFAIMVYVADIPELRETKIPDTDEGIAAMTELVIGGNTSLTELESICKHLSRKLGHRGLVLEACRKQLRYFAGRQIRNAASLAGNIATASPISDMNPVLLASGATVVAQSKDQGEISLPMETFFISYRKTSLPADSIITKIRIPIPPANVPEITKAYKQAKRKDDDIAIVTAAFRVRLGDDGKVDQISLAYGGMAPTTLLAQKTQEALAGQKWYDSRTLGVALRSLREEFNLSFDVPGGMATYRVTLALSFFFRFWHEVVAELKLGDVDGNLIEEIHRGISSGTRDHRNPHEQRVVGKQIPHLSGLKHNTGEAEYVDDMPHHARELYCAFVFSQRAHAILVEVDWSPAIGPGLAIGYVDKNDIPMELNSWGSVKRDEPFFADEFVHSHGQVIGLVYAETAIQAQKAARLVKVVYEDLPPILTIDEAIEANSFYPHPKQLRKGAAVEGSMDHVFSHCDRVFEGLIRMGGQEHFYLETNAALVIPHTEDGMMEVWSSTQNTMEVQEFVSQVTGMPRNRINSRVKRMGGAFGGKESRAVPFACALAVAAKKEKRPMRCMLNRDEDMMTSGQRHPFQARWKVGVMDDGTLVALDIDLYNNAGWSYDMSGAVMDRCATHIENCYEIPHVHVRGHLCKTNTHSNTAFRGFGGPQAMFIAETYMSAVAEGLGKPIDELRMMNLYKENDMTPFLQKIDEDWHIPRLMSELQAECDYEKRKSDIESFNRTNKWKKRGISLIPSKFGISFATAVHLNQASAAVKIFADGSVLLHHGGTEMGQGLYTKMIQVAAQELNVPIDAVYTSETASYFTANVSPTAASSGSDLNGMAIKDACDQLNERLRPYWEKFGPDASMKTIAHAAYLDRVNLSASGFWKMPEVGYQWGNYKDPKPMYYYFTQGVACSEVELDLLTGDHTVLRTDIKMDVGRSINPAIDYGQVEGAFVQGQGLFTMEESLWTRDGQLFTRGPGTYKIPGFSDIPQEFNVSFLQGVSWNHLRTIQSSKGIGEPPLFLGAAVLFALREALVSARKDNGIQEHLTLHSPATAERLRLAVGDDLLRMGTVVPKDGEKNFLVSVA
ncbi:xanthine dehydrogenase, molybdopterin binding subunit [Rhinocladiella mackenziei CBS 650.93]|uniref:Rhinocladiella mackenziei CBS 650.93 unplaced genomic scaffold supercont1.3, whole genome shotgun sequence n=1 Tax=Rhinocladiella mackenziei CBS 650.93 TaxID=1442369 RepID=A0A0D2ISW0_9EURO|nr:xanthine dehydrogenase, molybdopterin binding subunit [Rhinocladiella mackenziei CBS 650.93]KIX06271.1 xanthine dehydrogenase, molybdopterin binding subunit [Rhinocladiella mackenziei CBS 650.93]